MKGKKSLVSLWALLFILSIMLSTAYAGDEFDPEVNDSTGETDDPTKQFRDIDAAWFSEDENNLIISLKLAGAPPGLADLGQNQDTTNFDYEVYFDVEGQGYAAVATIQYAASIGAGTPLGGVYSTSGTWDWQLRSVDYASGTDTIASESDIEGITDNNYDSTNFVLEWEVDKDATGIGVGLDGRGKMVEDTWAAVWNADDNPQGSQRDPKTQAWDYGQTHYTNPGKTYRITGTAGVDYNVELSVQGESEQITYGGTPAIYSIKAQNNGTDDFLVDFDFTVSSEGWEVVINPNSTTIGKGASQKIEVSITPPKDVVNGTEMVVQITGKIWDVDGNNSVPILKPVTLKTIGLTPPDKDNSGGWLEDFIDMLTENWAIFAGAIAIVIVAIIVLAVLIKR
jgi:hypothetical protein